MTDSILSTERNHSIKLISSHRFDWINCDLLSETPEEKKKEWGKAEMAIPKVVKGNTKSR